MEKAECFSLWEVSPKLKRRKMISTHIKPLSLATDNHSFSSASIVSTISVPRPKVFPRGSGKISNESPEEDETKVYWIGLGLSLVAGGREDTRTVGETRKQL